MNKKVVKCMLAAAVAAVVFSAPQASAASFSVNLNRAGVSVQVNDKPRRHALADHERRHEEQARRDAERRRHEEQARREAERHHHHRHHMARR